MQGVLVDNLKAVIALVYYEAVLYLDKSSWLGVLLGLLRVQRFCSWDTFRSQNCSGFDRCKAEILLSS